MTSASLRSSAKQGSIQKQNNITSERTLLLARPLVLSAARVIENWFSSLLSMSRPYQMARAASTAYYSMSSAAHGQGPRLVFRVQSPQRDKWSTGWGSLAAGGAGGQMHVASQASPTAKETSGSRSSTGQHVFVITGRIDSVTRFVGVLIPHALWRLSGRRVVPGIHVAENYFHHPISNPQILTAQGQDRFTAKTKGGSRREL